MIEYGVVNACNMDGGSSSIMVYRDTYGLFGRSRYRAGDQQLFPAAGTPQKDADFLDWSLP